MATNTTDTTASVTSIMARVKTSPLQPPLLHGVVPPLAERYIRSIQQAHISLDAQVQSMNTTIQALQAQLNQQAITQAVATAAAAAKAVPPTPPTVTAAQGGVPLTSQGTPSVVSPSPPGTPVFTSLPPTTGSPLDVPGTYIHVSSGTPGIAAIGYYYRPPLTGSGPGYWYQDSTQSPSISDTAANMASYPAANYATGTVYHQTDTNVSYSVQNPSPGGTPQWLYYNGIQEDVLANIPGTLGLNDTGYYFRASDYLHNWKWLGSVWSLAAAAQSGLQGGATPGTLIVSVGGPPFGGTGALWHLCDGSTQNVSQENATVVATVLPTVANTWYAR